MTHFFVDNRPQADGAHQVHCQGCMHMASDKQYLGFFSGHTHALLEARKVFWNTIDCLHCSPTSGGTMRIKAIDPSMFETTLPAHQRAV